MATSLAARKSPPASTRTAPPPSTPTKRFIPLTELEYRRSGAWGMLTSLDIHDCNPKTIRDAKAVERFAHLLCDRIGMKRFGPTTVVDFGEDPRVSGFSMTQLIETSLVSGHFANQTNAVYLDVFSCKFYDAQAVIDEAVMFFGGKSFNVHCVLRGCENFPEDYRKEFPDRNILLNSVPAVA